MKSVDYLFLLITTMLCVSCTTKNKVPDHLVEAKFLLEKMKFIADSGFLFEPTKTASVLNSAIRDGSDRKLTKLQSCDDPYASRTWQRKEYEVSSRWLKPTAAGVKDMYVPAAFINMAAKIGNPGISYKIENEENCTGNRDPLHKISARLNAYGLSFYACITPAYAASFFHSSLNTVTDGVMTIEYDGYISDQSGALLSVVFRIGAPCAIELTIDQSTELGLRYRWVDREFKSCEKAANVNFCRARHLTDVGNEGDAMKLDALKYCGTFESRFKKHPHPYTSPPPKQTEYYGPCNPNIAGPYLKKPFNISW